MKIFSFIGMLLLLTELSYSQLLEGEDASAYINDATTVRISEISGNPSFIHFKESSQLTQAELSAWVIKNISLPEHSELTLLQSQTDYLGFTHYKYQQVIFGFPVEGANVVAHTKDNRVESISGELFDLNTVNYQPAISEQDALNKALAYFKAKIYKWEIPEEETVLKNELQNPSATYYPKGILVLAPEEMNFKNTFHLAYKFDIYSHEPNKRAYVYVDAGSGKMIGDISIINYGDAVGTAITKYSGSRSITADSQTGYYRLRESDRGDGIRTLNMNQGKKYSNAVDFTDSDNYWDNINPQQDEAATDAHWAAEQTFDYYLNTFGRNSFDDQGTRVVSYVHYDTSYGNAFFNGSALVYGDGGGQGTTFTGPLTPLDICAHEFTHGVTQSSAGLYYSAESGALNESFSDIFGTIVEFAVKSTSADWIIGKENTNNSSGIRDMSNPNRLHDPDTYMGNNWRPLASTCDTTNDYCGVHTNSGVQNYWFYLISEGGSGINDKGNSYSISGIGIQKAAAIAYRALTVYLTPTSEYSDARYYSIEAAKDLYGGCSNEAIQTTNAWYAVGVGNVFSGDVVADFHPYRVYECLGNPGFAFINNSTDASIYQWNFGDGATSGLKDPTHSYPNLIGTYTVTLVVSNNNSCSDTTQRSVFVGGLLPASCTPSFTGNFSTGIGGVSLNMINISTSHNPGYYTDNSCSYNTYLTQAKTYPISIGIGSYRYARVWIDYNNDLTFDPTAELIFFSATSAPSTITVPSNVVLNAPLRMRVCSSAQPSFLPCGPISGEAEDYMVVILPNLESPVANFGAADSISCNGTISFHDSSLNVVTSWLWDFGDGNTSIQQHPAHYYTASGSFDITLIVCSIRGCDTLTKKDYVKVYGSAQSCDTVYIPTNGDTLITHECFGNILDQQINSNHHGNILIAPPGAASVTLYVYFHYYYSTNTVTIFDGPDRYSPVLRNYNGVFNGIIDTITSTGRSVFIYQSLGSLHPDPREGFGAFWQADGPPVAPVADFSLNYADVPLNTSVQFIDLSSPGFGDWRWNFGDGSYSSLQHPQHQYHSSGMYNVELTINNCYGSDSTQQTIHVQEAPGFSINLDTIRVTGTDCDSIISIPATIYNSGTGDLYIEKFFARSSAYGPVGDSSVLIIGLQSANAVNTHLSNYSITARVISPTLIPYEDFSQYDVIYISEEQPIYYIVDNSAQFESFVSQGGILYYGLYNIATSGFNLIDSIRCLYGNYEKYHKVLEHGHPIMANMDDTIWISSSASLNNTYFTNLNGQVHILTETAASHVPTTIEYDYGKGKVIASTMGVIHYSFSSLSNIEPMLGNLIAHTFSLIGRTPEWVSIDSSNKIIAPGDSVTVHIEINPQDLINGEHLTNVYISTNDSQRYETVIPVYFELHGSPKMVLSDTCIDLGNVPIGLPVTDSILISNEGCDTLNVFNVNISDNHFTVADTSFSVLPGQVHALKVTHAPDTTGHSSATIEILNSQRDTSICVSADAYYPPLIAVTANQLVITAQRCQNLVSVPFTIYNSGLSPLNWVLNISGTGLSANPRNGYVASEDSAAISLILYINGLNNGQYTRVFSIQSNDPSKPEITVSVILSVVSDSCIPKPAFSFLNSSCGNIVTFIDSTTNNPTSRQWQFGDGSFSSVLSPAHAYTTSGTYTVTLTASNSYGNASKGHIIDVDFVQTAITAPDTSHVGEIVQLNSNSSIGAISWNWDFGDTQTSDLKNPAHVYSSTGIFSITLSAENLSGCSASDSFLITIEPPVSVNRPTPDNTIHIYPNPAKQAIYIEYESMTGNETIRIFNTVGKIVFEKNIQRLGIDKYEIDISGYSKGTYLVEIIGDIVFTKKIVID